MATDGHGSAPIAGEPRVCTVTFGRSSFIGRSLVAALLKSGEWTVRIADPSPPPDQAADPILSGEIQSGRASYHQVDFASRSELISAVDRSSAVFHVDPTTVRSLTVGRSFCQLYAISVQGTKNLIAACMERHVVGLVFTGSADEMFDGLLGGDKFADEVSDLRAQVEAIVLSVNGRDGLLTCVLRPSNPFGPGDDRIVPFLVGEAKSGRAKFIIGNGKNMRDFTYIENVSHANICAGQALCSKVASVAGKDFFITNNEPVELWVFIANILEGLGYKRPNIHLPLKLVLFFLLLVEWVHKKFVIIFSLHLSSTMVRRLSEKRTFDSSEAQRSIEYSPIVPLEDGVTFTVQSFLQPLSDSPIFRQQDFSQPSKADGFLGSGSVADVLLWRNDKRTFSYLLGIFLLFHWFFLSGRTFVSSTAKLLILISIALFSHGVLPSSIYGFPMPNVSSSYFEVSELHMRNSFIALASLWNKGIFALKSLSGGDGWEVLFKAVGILLLVMLLLSIPLSTLVALGCICLFTLFVVYDQCEEEVDRMMTVIAVGVKMLRKKLIKLPDLLVMRFFKS